MARFSTVDDFLDSLASPEHRDKLKGLLDWIADTWPELELVVKWNQPMFTHHGTFIIGFSAFAKNIAVAPEDSVLERFRTQVEAAGYTTTAKLIRIRWEDPIDRPLLTRIIDTQITEKAGTTDFWRR